MSDLVRQSRPVTAILVEAGVVSPEQIGEALERQKSTGLRVGETLVEMGVATEEDIGWALARQFGVPFVDVVPVAIDTELVRRFPEALLRRLNAIPLVRGPDGVSIALTDPTDEGAIEELEHAARGPLNVSLSTRAAIAAALDAVWGARLEASASRPAADESSSPATVRDRSGTGFLQFHVLQALSSGASDIHFLPDGESLRVQHRVGAHLVEAATVQAHALFGLLARLEALGGPAIDGGGDHASGRVVCPLGDREVLLDVSMLNCEHGIAVTLGLREHPWSALPIESAGFQPIDLARIRAALDSPAGVVLVAGPPRAGCSTTLSSLLGAVHSESRRSLAIERQTGTPMPAGIRLALDSRRAREVWEEIVIGQDAEVVVLDDVLRGDSIGGMLSSAVTGRLLLATTDWADSFDLIDHLLEQPGARAVLAGRLQVIIQQRMPRGDAPLPHGDGVQGRLIRPRLYEVLVIGDAMRQALRDGQGGTRIRELAVADGFRTMSEEAARRVTEHTLSPAEAARILT